MGDRVGGGKVFILFGLLFFVALTTILYSGSFRREESIEEETSIEEERRIFKEEELVFREERDEERDVKRDEERRIFKEEELVFREEREYLEAEGLGFSPSGTNIEQMKLLARRGAMVEARRNLLALLTEDATHIEGLIEGAFVVEGSEEFFQLEDGRMGCTLRMGLYKDNSR